MLELLAPQALGVLRVFLQQTFVGVACHVRVFEQALHLLYALCGFFVGLFGQFAALEDGVHALDGADGHVDRCVDLLTLQVLDEVFHATLVVVVGAGVSIKLSFGLAGLVALSSETARGACPQS